MNEIRQVRPDVVEDLVRRLAAGGVDALAVEVEARLRQMLSTDEVLSGVTPAESAWAMQRFRGMTVEERAQMVREAKDRGLRLVRDEED